MPLSALDVLAGVATALGVPNDDRLRAAIVAVHDIKAGRSSLVRVGEAEALHFPDVLDTTFATFLAAGAPEPRGARALWTVGPELGQARYGWTPAGLIAADEVSSDEVRWVAARLERIAAHVARPSGATLGDLDLLGAEERSAVLSKCHGPRAKIDDVRVLELMLEVARGEPKRPAFVDPQRSWTYGELARRAHAYALAFSERVAVDDAVGISLPRGGESVAAMLGAWWCGAAYVFVDPEYPAPRKQLMLEDSAAKVLVHGPGDAVDGVPSVLTTTLVETDLTLPPKRGQFAYIVYTSGSTGSPKGVRVFHLGVAKELEGLRRLTDLDEDDVLLATASPSFDVSVAEQLVPLAVGARVHVIPATDVLDGVRLREHVERVRPTMIGLLRLVCESLLDAGFEGDRKLRISFGGEAARGDLARRVAAMNGALYNCYGPTEASMTSTLHRIRANEKDPIPIGRPLPNVDVYVLDDRGRLQPFGFAGELHIGGAGVSDGYVGKPELTSERFPTLDLEGRPVRVYRSGDIVSLRPSGELDFVGRKDEQVKLRGFRIELGEVVAALRASPGVRDVVAIVKGDELIAYLLASSADAVANDCAALRRHLVDRLPRYMLPHHYVVLDKWPLNANNKLDLGRLPSPSGGGAAVADASSASNGAAPPTKYRSVVSLTRRPEDAARAPRSPNVVLDAGDAGALSPPPPPHEGKREMRAQRIERAIDGAAALALLGALVRNHGAVRTCTTELAAPLDVERLQDAWMSVMADTPALRTRFALDGAVPLAIAEGAFVPRFTVWDESQLPLAGYRAHVESVERRRREETFDVEHSPHAALDVVRGPDGTTTVIVAHASFLLDAHGTRALMQSLWARYEGSARSPRTPNDERSPASAVASLGALRATASAAAKPTRIPRDSDLRSLVGLSRGIARLGARRSISAVLGTRRGRALAALVDASGNVGRLVDTMAGGTPETDVVFVPTTLADRTRARAEELGIAETACVLAAYATVLARWTSASSAIVRVVAPTDVTTPLALDVTPGKTLETVLRDADASLRAVLETNEAREAVRGALPFREPVTDALFVIGPSDEVEPPASVAPIACRVVEATDGLFVLDVRWRRGELRLQWDRTRVRAETARRKLEEVLHLLEDIVTSPRETPIERLLG